jgi:nucleotide-binding universal stress UspA family protein
MQMLKKILVPTDFSEEANNALEVAVHVARRTGAQLKVVHIVEPPYSPSFSAMGTYVPPTSMNDVFIFKLIEHSRERMRELVQKGQYQDVSIHYDVDVDRVIDRIRRAVDEEGVDLVVMGSKGVSGMDEMLIGSNTEKVVRLASCPVLTVKRRHESFEVQRILFPFNFEEDLSPVVGRVQEAQALFGAHLLLLYVNTPGAFVSTLDIRQRMDQFAEKYKLHNFSSHIWNDESEEDGVLQFADQSNADLIMMVTHGRTGLNRLLSGSITEGLVNHTVRPVLTFSIKAMGLKAK